MFAWRLGYVRGQRERDDSEYIQQMDKMVRKRTMLRINCIRKKESASCKLHMNFGYHFSDPRYLTLQWLQVYRSFDCRPLITVKIDPRTARILVHNNTRGLRNQIKNNLHQNGALGARAWPITRNTHRNKHPCNIILGIKCAANDYIILSSLLILRFFFFFSFEFFAPFKIQITLKVDAKKANDVCGKNGELCDVMC